MGYMKSAKVWKLHLKHTDSLAKWRPNWAKTIAWTKDRQSLPHERSGYIILDRANMFIGSKQKHSVKYTIKMKPPLLTAWRAEDHETSSNTGESPPHLLSTRLFRRQSKPLLSSFTTDKHRHIKTSMLKSGNSPFNSRQTQWEEVNYRMGATQPFWKIHLQ